MASNDTNRFSYAIQLRKDWPVKNWCHGHVDISVRLKWALAYYRASKELYEKFLDRNDVPFFCGPLIHNVGVASELVLKAMLYGIGLDETELRKLGHKTYDSFVRARESFNEQDFNDLVFDNTLHLQLPKEIADRCETMRIEDVELGWRLYANHLLILDEIYDRPFRTRYIKPGSFVTSEPHILLVGASILISAMVERVFPCTWPVVSPCPKDIG